LSQHFMSARGRINALIIAPHFIMSAVLLCRIIFKEGFAVAVSDGITDVRCNVT
jgi:hypothetical protein